MTPMRERPDSILLLALLNLLVAGVCLFVGVAKAGRMLVMSAMPPGQREDLFLGRFQDRTVPIPDLESYLEFEVPGYGAWELAALVGTLCTGVLLLAVARGLLHMRPWARWLALLYAVAMLFWQGAYVVFQLRQVLPVAEIYFLDESWRSYFYMPTAVDLARTGFVAFVFIPAALLVGHALVALGVLWLPSVTAAFAGKTEEAAAPMTDKVVSCSI
jgi:hypothetical protein